MKTPARRLTNAGALAVLLGLCLHNPVLAAETPRVGHVPLKSMNQAEYERYHELLDRQLRSVSKETPPQNSPAAEQSAGTQAEIAPEQDAGKSEGSGYGKGYAARREMGGASAAGRAGGYRGGSGSMSRGGGRYR